MCHLRKDGDVGGFGLDRREFLCSLGGTAAAAGLGGAAAAADAQAPAATPAPKDRPVPLIRAVYLRPRGPYWLGWPGTAFDIEGHCRDYEANLGAFGKKLGVEVRFEAEPVYDNPGMEAFIKKVQDERPDAILLIPLHMNQWGQVDRITQAYTPALVFAGLGTCFTGHIAGVSRRPGVYLMSTNDFDLSPVQQAMRMVWTAHKMKHTRVAVLRGNERRAQTLAPVGLTLSYMPRNRFAEVFKSIPDTDEVKSIAEYYTKTAEKIVEPSKEDILNAARTYVACKRVMAEENCDAITMDCLGLVAERLIPCPPCLAFSKLLDEGIGGTCEADINAVLSHNLCAFLLGRSGFQQDPVPETVHNTFIGAHCTATTRLNGFDRDPEPFILRSHSESNVGVSMQVLFRPEQRVTIMQFVGPGKMIVGSGKVLNNCDTPPAGGCRTSVHLAIDAPADTRDTKGFHQLFIYGDYARVFQAYGQMYGIATESI
ncbi:MAG: hypothetical protein JXP34_20845 [Planctomycetes bacterium]|nr:hypothetical protein [Planctomycetota bacterium]